MSEDEEESDDSTFCFCVIINFGAFLRCSRNSSLISQKKKKVLQFYSFVCGESKDEERKYQMRKVFLTLVLQGQ